MIRRQAALRGRGRAHLRALVLAVFLGTAFAPCSVAAQVTVEELEVHLRPPATGGQQTHAIPVRNELDRVQQVRVLLGDWERDSLGRNVFLGAGTHASSCRERLKAFPMTFQLAPGAVEYVRVTYDPEPLEKGCWSIVFFETVTPPRPASQQASSAVTIEIRTGVKVYVHAPGATILGEITEADIVRAWRPKDPTSTARDSVAVWQAALRLANTGTDHVRAKTTLEVRGADGKLLHTVPAPEAYMTPGAVRDLAIELPALAAGQYLALLLVDFGGAEITAAQLEFRIP